MLTCGPVQVSLNVRCNVAFRSIGSEREQWKRFCEKNAGLLAALSHISLVFRTPARFEDLLQRGVTSSKDAEVTLQALSDSQWRSFVLFVDQYSDQWQTWFVESLYPAYFREAKCRGVSHLTNRST